MSVLDAAGGTPMVRLRRLKPPEAATVLLKLEGFNPTGSVKFRAALEMIRRAEAEGKLRPGGTIVEPSSGNLAVALAAVGAAKRYSVITVLDPRVSRTNMATITAFGGRTVIVNERDERGAWQGTRLAKARELVSEIPDAYMCYQYGNPANPKAHEESTAPEILRDVGDTAIDCAVIGISTAGQVTGIGRGLKKANPNTEVVAVDSSGSVIFGGAYESYSLRGLGLSWVPENLDWNVVDEGYKVTDAQAFSAARVLAQREGILCGASSGAVLLVALRKAMTYGATKTVLAVLPDRGEKYFDQFYNDDWMQEHGFPLSVSPADLLTTARDLSPVYVRKLKG